MAKISVIVTTYNRELFLSQTITSILNQTFADFELIIVDNFSNYNIESLILSFNDPRVVLFKNKNYGVIATNRNYGIERAKGDYLAFCDDDDIWVKDKLSIQNQIIDTSGCDLVYSGMFIFKDEINEKQVNVGRKVFSFDDMLWGNPIVLSSVLVKNQSSVRFPIDQKFVTIEDYFLWLVLYNNGFKFSVYDKPLIYYRLSDSNYSINVGYLKYLKLLHLYKFVFCNFTIKYSKIKLFSLVFINVLKFCLKFIFFKDGVKR